MEYEINATNALLLKKAILLFRHISVDLQIIASENGLNLYALNQSNSVWLHIQLGQGFFERIQFNPPNNNDSETVPAVKHWFVSSKHLCQSLALIIPPGLRTSPHKALLIKDLSGHEDLKHSSGLDRLIIKEYQDSTEFLSLIFVCSNKNIVRSATVGFQDLGWSNWHYLRISPSVFGKSIGPFSSNYNDLSITYHDSKEDLLLKVINNTSKLSLNAKKKSMSGKVLINSRHFHKLDLDDGLTYPEGITIAIREFLSLVSFCESTKCPLSLVLRKPGDPVIALFGGSVNACETVTSNLNIHKIVYNGCNDLGHQNETSQTADVPPFSGSLWISSFKVPTTVNVTQEELFEEHFEETEEEPEPETVDISMPDGDRSQQKENERPQFTSEELDEIYKLLLEDFMTDKIETEPPDPSVYRGQGQLVTHSPGGDKFILLSTPKA